MYECILVRGSQQDHLTREDSRTRSENAISGKHNAGTLDGLPILVELALVAVIAVMAASIFTPMVAIVPTSTAVFIPLARAIMLLLRSTLTGVLAVTVGGLVLG